jgi:hypothetical protein
MIIAVIFIAGGAVYASRNTERTNDVDSDIRVYVPCRDRDRSGNQSDYLGLDDEAVKGILTVMRMSVRYSEAEQLAIDYCIDRLEAENG